MLGTDQEKYMPKRKGFLMSKIYDINNIELADNNARKNKGFKRVIKKHDSLRELDNWMLLTDLYFRTYKTSKYTVFKIYEPKERVIYKLPYYPDRICHHAIMNVLEPIWKSKFIRTTYSSIKGRGIHLCAKDVKKALREHPNDTLYCLKLDVHKFYPSIDHDCLKKILSRWTKDPNFDKINNEIIDSESGVPIGNYLSLYYANLYLTPLDHLMKLYCKYYFRYADDIVILHSDKEFLHKMLELIKSELSKIKLTIKPNYQIFPVDDRGISFVGYVFFHTHTLLRKSIKKNLMKLVYSYVNKKISKDKFLHSITAYQGWLKFCDSKNLCLKIEKLTGIPMSNWNGRKKSYKWLTKQNLYCVCYNIVQRSHYIILQYTNNYHSYETIIKDPKLIEYFLKLYGYGNNTLK